MNQKKDELYTIMAVFEEIGPVKFDKVPSKIAQEFVGMVKACKGMFTLPTKHKEVLFGPGYNMTKLVTCTVIEYVEPLKIAQPDKQIIVPS